MREEWSGKAAGLSLPVYFGLHTTIVFAMAAGKSGQINNIDMGDKADDKLDWLVRKHLSDLPVSDDDARAFIIDLLETATSIAKGETKL